MLLVSKSLPKVYLKSFWSHPGVILEPSWCHPGVILTSSWHHPEVILPLTWMEGAYLLGFVVPKSNVVRWWWWWWWWWWCKPIIRYNSNSTLSWELEVERWELSWSLTKKQNNYIQSITIHRTFQWFHWCGHTHSWWDLTWKMHVWAVPFSAHCCRLTHSWSRSAAHTTSHSHTQSWGPGSWAEYCAPRILLPTLA